MISVEKSITLISKTSTKEQLISRIIYTVLYTCSLESSTLRCVGNRNIFNKSVNPIIGHLPNALLSINRC